MGSKPDFRRLARDSSYNLIRQGWTIIIGMAISILLARALGKEDRGIYTLVILLPQMLVSFLNLGIGPATAFYVSRKDHEFHQAVRENIGLTFWISLGTILVGLAIIFLFGDLLFPDVSRNYLLLSLLVIPMSLLVSYLVSIFQGIQDFRLFNLIGMIIQLVMVVLVAVLVWWLAKGVLGAIWAYLGSNFVGTVLLLAIIRKQTRPHRLFSFKVDRSYVRQVLNYGLKAHFSNMITFLNYRADNFLLNYLSGAVSVGIYSVSVGLGEQLWIPSNAIASVIMPRIASLSDDEEQRKQITPMTTRFVFWFSLLIAVFVWLLAQWGIVLLYGAEYRQSAAALRALLPGIVMFNAARILANDLAGRGKPEINLYTSAFALVINVIANLLLAPPLGAIGASLSSSISYSLMTIILMLIYIRITQVSWKDILILNRTDMKNLKKLLVLAIATLRMKWLATG